MSESCDYTADSGQAREQVMAAYLLMEHIVIPYVRETSSERALSTQKREAEICRSLERHWGRLWVSQYRDHNGLTGYVVRQYREDRKAEGVGAETIKRELALVSTAINYAATGTGSRILAWWCRLRDANCPAHITGRDRASWQKGPLEAQGVWCRL